MIYAATTTARPKNSKSHSMSCLLTLPLPLKGTMIWFTIAIKPKNERKIIVE
jgi:hypothetical protein